MRRHAGWLAGAVAVAGSVAGGVLAPASWWALGFVAGVVATMVGLRGVVSAGYRAAWTRSTVLVSLPAVCLAGGYAFMVPPLGPSSVGYAFVVPFLLMVLVLVRDAAQVGGGERVQLERSRVYLSGGRRR